jgi:hypothetical protein
MSLVVGLSSCVPEFAPGSVRVGFVLDKVALGQVFLRVFFGFTLSVSFHRGFPYSYIIWEMGNRPYGGRSSETLFHLIYMNKDKFK